MNADTREWWVIQDGQVRFSIDGQEPKGHFHTESSEFWFILLGQIRYTIEGLPTFVADQGDIVYVPKQRWHLASFAGTGMSARLAMNGYTDLAHSFEAPDTSDASR
jgi:quercetin dioxygenase-like cupin family protein